MNFIHLSALGLGGEPDRQEIIGCRILVCVSGPNLPFLNTDELESLGGFTAVRMGSGGHRETDGGGGGRRAQKG